MKVKQLKTGFGICLKNKICMKEKTLEKKLRETVSDMGGLAIKMPSIFFTGFPDRLVLMPGGRMFFAETKTTGEKLSKRQEVVKAQLERLGFEVYKIDDNDSYKKFIQRLGR